MTAPRASAQATFGVARLAEETRERFVREIVARVPLERVAELHLFPPIRQGGMESGVAVLAALPAVPEPTADAASDPAEASAPTAAADGRAADEAPAPPAAGETTSRADPSAAAVAETGTLEADADARVAAAASAEPSAGAGDASPVATDAPTAPAGAALADDSAARCDPTEAAAGPPPDGHEEDVATDVSPAADDRVAGDARGVPPADPGAVPGDADAVEPPPVAPAPDVPPAPPARRRTVFTASYRLVLKGPDRGRWQVEVREEADAPLVTVEAVVRGVQSRAGDIADPERFEAAGVARLLGLRPDAPADGGGTPPA